MEEIIQNFMLGSSSGWGSGWGSGEGSGSGEGWGEGSGNVINLKPLLNGKQNVWKNRSDEEKSDLGEWEKGAL